MIDYALMNQCIYDGKAKEVEQLTQALLLRLVELQFAAGAIDRLGPPARHVLGLKVSPAPLIATVRRSGG